MAIKPILFNIEMVRAILDGRKSCTRRIVKPQWEECLNCKYVHNEYIYDKLAENVYCARCGYPLVPERRAPYQPGDILYVRETWCGLPVNEAGHMRGHTIYYYKADGDLRPEGWRGAWRPSIHMPKEAAKYLGLVKIHGTVGKAIEACVAYEEIGTLEECREAMEKQRRKIVKNPYGTSYIWKAGYCPVCGCGVTARWDYCQCCGQKLNWQV